MLKQNLGMHAGYMEQLRQREKEAGIEPDPEIDAFMRASTVSGKRHSLVTELTLRILGLEVNPSASLHVCLSAFQVSHSLLHVFHIFCRFPSWASLGLSSDAQHVSCRVR